MQVKVIRNVAVFGSLLAVLASGASADDGGIKWGAKFFPLHKQQSANTSAASSKGAGAPVKRNSFFSLAAVRVSSNPNSMKLQYKPRNENRGEPKTPVVAKPVAPKQESEEKEEVQIASLPDPAEALKYEKAEEVQEVKAATDSEIAEELDEELPEEIAGKPDYQKAIRSILPKMAHAWPFDKGDAERITSMFGWRTHPVTHAHAFHQGVDIAAPVGTTVLASADGVVADAGKHGNLGNYVKIQHGDGSYSIYGHLKNWVVKVGELVKQGDKIAEVGMTGRTTGPHLHYSIVVDGKAANPMKFLKKNLPDSQVALVM